MTPGVRADASSRKASKQTNTSAKLATPEELQAVRDEVQRLVGKDAPVEFPDMINGTDGKPWAGDHTPELIQVAMSAADFMLGTGRHEALHRLFSFLNEYGGKQTRATLESVAMSPLIQRRLRQLLAEDHPDAWEQAQTSPEEAAAYMFQFWKAGMLNLGPKAETFFQRAIALIKRITGLVSQQVRDERSANIVFAAFDKGDYATEPDAATKRIEKELGEQRREFGHRVLKAIVDSPKMKKFAFTSGAVLRSIKDNTFFSGIADQFQNLEGTAMTEQGFLDASQQSRIKYLNKVKRMLEKVDPVDAASALEFLQAEVDTNKINDPVVQKIVKDVRKHMAEMYEFMQLKKMQRFSDEAKAWINIPEFKTNYFTRVWSSEFIQANSAELKADLLKYHDRELTDTAQLANEEVAADNVKKGSAAEAVQGRLVTKDDIATAIVMKLSHNGALDVEESGSELGITPYARAVNKRSLTWLDAKHFTKYMEKDLVSILSNYTVQVTKRGEYTSRFGNEGEKLGYQVDQGYTFELLRGEKYADQGVAEAAHEVALKDWKRRKAQTLAAKEVFDEPKPTLRDAARDELLNARTKQGVKGDDIQKGVDAKVAATVELIRPMVDAVTAGEGTIGRDINPTIRTIQSNLMAYTNVRLLPLVLFSSLGDTAGVLTQGGTMKDAYEGFVRGIKGVISVYKTNPDFKNDDLTNIAEWLGIVDSGVFLDALGQMYGSMYMTGMAKNVNEKLFRYNGMEAWNRAVRIQATGAAIGFIKQHLNNPTEHSARRLKELNLRAEDRASYMDATELDYDNPVVLQATELDYENPVVQQAIMRWVDGAILRPNAMQRPTAASDPHYAIFYHLKSFTYSFHKTILRRAYVEAQNDNYRPVAALIGVYLPMVIAADVLKELLVPGDDPAWMRSLGGVVKHGASRANFGGIPQLGFGALPGSFDQATSPRLVFDAADLAGPIVGQLTKLLAVPLTEEQSVGSELLRATPLSPIWTRMAR